MIEKNSSFKIALIIPCYNEEISIARTIESFKNVLPFLEIYVCDNNSSDKTGLVATQAGAKVFFEKNAGKGHAVRRLFSEVTADIYIMTDGDLTYDAKIAPSLIETLCDNNLDMVIGRRVEAGNGEAYRPGHKTGNKIFNLFLKYLFKSDFNDIFSGYRIFSKRLVKSFSATSKGFEIEIELTIHCLSLNLPCKEVDCDYFPRIQGSFSKLNKYRDGFKIFLKMIRLLVEYRPLFFFGTLCFLIFIVSTILFIPILLTYFKTGLVPRTPTLIVVFSLYSMTLFLFLFSILAHYISKIKVEFKRLFYMTY